MKNKHGLSAKGVRALIRAEAAQYKITAPKVKIPRKGLPTGYPGLGFYTLSQMAHGFAPREIMDQMAEDGTDLGQPMVDPRTSPEVIIWSNVRRQKLEDEATRLLVEAGFCEDPNTEVDYGYEYGPMVMHIVSDVAVDLRLGHYFEGDRIQASIEILQHPESVPVQSWTVDADEVERNRSQSEPHRRPHNRRKRAQGMSSDDHPVVSYDPTGHIQDRKVLDMAAMLSGNSAARLRDELKPLTDGIPATVSDLLEESGTRTLRLATESGSKPDFRAHCQQRDQIERCIGKAALPSTFMVSTETLVEDVACNRLDEDEVRVELQLRGDLRLAGGEQKRWKAFGPLNDFNRALRLAKAEYEKSCQDELELAVQAEPLHRFPVLLLVATARICRNISMVRSKSKAGSLAKELTVELKGMIKDDPPTVTPETAGSLVAMLTALSNSTRDSVRDTVERALTREAHVAKCNGERDNRAAWDRKNRFTRIFSRWLTSRRNASAKANGKTDAKPVTSQPQAERPGAPAPSRPRRR
jgi:hypothetical protein